MSFAAGSDILLDFIQQDMADLASMPVGSHIGQLGTSMIDGSLPPQFLMQYDYDFLYRMKCTLLGLRWIAGNKLPVIAHSVMEELLIYLCNEEAQAMLELSEGMEDAGESGDAYLGDWVFDLFDDEASSRKELIAENPTQFLYFTKPSNKGTIQTAEMLMEAQDEEERAAVWIGATAFELMGSRYTNECYRYAAVLYNAACGFLRQRCGVWHHAMRRLVPEIMIPNAILDSIRYDQPETVMGLIQTNIVMLRGTHTVLLYSSLKDGERPL